MVKKSKYTKAIDWNPEKANDFLNEPRIRKMIQLAGTGHKVLDVGCYSGDISLAIKNNGNEVVGLDSNVTFVKMAKERGIPAKFADFEEKFPVASNSFDVIVAGEIIEHIYHTEKFLQECHRVLKKGGELVITTPNINWFWYRFKMLFGKTLPYAIEAGEDTEACPGHVRYYTVDSLTKTLQKFGFKVELVTSSNMLNGKVTFEKVAEIWPSMGYHIIVKAKKEA